MSSKRGKRPSVPARKRVSVGVGVKVMDDDVGDGGDVLLKIGVPIRNPKKGVVRTAGWAKSANGRRASGPVRPKIFFPENEFWKIYTSK